MKIMYICEYCDFSSINEDNVIKHEKTCKNKSSCQHNERFRTFGCINACIVCELEKTYKEFKDFKKKILDLFHSQSGNWLELRTSLEKEFS